MPRAKMKKTGAVEDVLEQAQAVLSRSWKATLKALPAAPGEVVQNLSKRVDQIAKDVRKGRKGLVKRIEKTIQQLDRRRQRVLATVEKRSSAIVDAAEERTAEALKPLAKRLDLASHTHVEELQKRLARVESKLSGPKAQTRPRRRAA